MKAAEIRKLRLEEPGLLYGILIELVAQVADLNEKMSAVSIERPGVKIVRLIDVGTIEQGPGTEMICPQCSYKAVPQTDAQGE